MNCWTCGYEMEESLWHIAPREPSDPSLRSCPACHDRIEFSRDALAIMNMIRYVAGIPQVPKWYAEVNEL